MNISDLPDEILEKIFSYIPVGTGQRRSLIAATEVCKRFNTIIGNNQKLMQKIIISWREARNRDTKAVLESYRRYTRVECSGVDRETYCLIAFLEQQTSITSLSVHLCKFKYAELWSILNCIQNSVEILKMSYLQFTDHADPSIVPLFFPNLRKLKWHTACETNYELFKVSKKFEELDTSHSSKILNLEEFLITAVGLKRFIIDELSTSQVFKDSYLTERARFKLEELTISIDSIEDLELEILFTNIADFLKTQTLLTKLHFLGDEILPLNDDILEAIHEIPALTDLQLEASEYWCYIGNTSVKKLHLSSWHGTTQHDSAEWKLGMCQMIKSFPFITELKIFDIQVTKKMSNKIIKHLKRLLSVEFHFEDEGPNVNSLDNIMNILEANPQLVEIIIPKAAEKHSSFEEVMSLFDKTKVAISYFY